MMRPLLKCAAAGALTLAANAADFSYYMLSVSYGPEVCTHTVVKDSRECGSLRSAFLVRGLLPRTESGEPQNCGRSRPVAADLVKRMLDYFPTEALVQDAWDKHGVCTGSSAADYFAAVQRTKDSIRIPQRFTEIRGRILISPAEIVNEFHRANPGVPLDALRTACYSDGGLQEIRFCFDRDLNPRPCTGVLDCTKAVVRLSPPAPRGR